MTYIIAYDIGDRKRREHIAKLLANYGNRIQYSIFLCELNKELLNILVNKLLLIINDKEDSVHVYPLCDNCFNRQITMHNNQSIRKNTFLIL